MSGDSYLWPDGFRSAACFTLDLDAHAPYLWTRRQKMPPFLSHLEQRRFGPRVGIHRILVASAVLSLLGSLLLLAQAQHEQPPGWVASLPVWVYALIGPAISLYMWRRARLRPVTPEASAS